MINRDDIETYVEAARLHGEDEHPDHEVGDLQDMLRAAWRVLTPEQRKGLVRDDAFERTLECGYLTDFIPIDPEEQDEEPGPTGG